MAPGIFLCVVQAGGPATPSGMAAMTPDVWFALTGGLDCLTQSARKGGAPQPTFCPRQTMSVCSVVDIHPHADVHSTACASAFSNMSERSGASSRIGGCLGSSVHRGRNRAQMVAKPTNVVLGPWRRTPSPHLPFRANVRPSASPAPAPSSGGSSWHHQELERTS